MKMSDCLFSGGRERERENESLGGIVGTTSIMPVLAIPCVGSRGAQGQVENKRPFPFVLLRVALSRLFREMIEVDHRYFIVDTLRKDYLEI